MQRIVSAVTLFLVMGTVASAAAHGIPGRPAPAAQTSVFPIPRDPWRSWGDVKNDGRHRGRPRSESHVVAPGMWVPGQWVWDGATWQWWPGHWVLN
jgi:hypothetical protein